MRKYFSIAIIAGLMCMPAVAQDLPTAEKSNCTSRIYIWSGTKTETASIIERPVPESFLEKYDGSICTRFQLSETSLLSWHSKFGTEMSMHAAVEFLTSDINNELKTNLNIDNIKDVKAQINAYGSIANLYFVGAEAFNSETMIKEAVYYYKKANELVKVIPLGERGVGLRHRGNFGMKSHHKVWQKSASRTDFEYVLLNLAQNIFDTRALITGNQKYDWPQ